MRGGNSGAEELPEKIVIGTISNIHDQGLAIAKGYLEEAFGDDIEIDVVVFNGGGDYIKAMMSGDIDFTYGGCVPVVSGLANGMEAKVIWIQNLLNVSDAVAAREDSDIDSLADLEGKTVAAPFTSPIHYAFERGLEKSGVDITKVTMLDMQPEEIYAAWTRGDIDVAVVWDPVLSTLEGSKIIYTAGEAAECGFPVFDVGIVRDDFAEAYPELVVKYVQAMEKAQQLKKNDIDDAIATLADYMELSIEDATTQIAGSIWLTGEEQLTEPYFGGQMAENLYQMALYLYNGGNLAEEPDMSVFEDAIDASYIKKALEK